MDIKSTEERSKNMSRIKSTSTKPEIYIRKLLFSRGIRYRKNFNKIEGKPDLYISKNRTAIFVHGCFWHRHSGCKYAYVPKSNIDKWNKKFECNIARDTAVIDKLKQNGEKVLVIWECTIKRMQKDLDFKETVYELIVKFVADQTEMYLEI